MELYASVCLLRCFRYCGAQLTYTDLACAMLEVGSKGLYIGEEVAVDCTAPASEVVPLEGAFKMQYAILRDNLRRKVLPYALAGVAVGVLGYSIHRLVGRRGRSESPPEH
jgi:hypothetical protein